VAIHIEHLAKICISTCNQQTHFTLSTKIKGISAKPIFQLQPTFDKNKNRL